MKNIDELRNMMKSIQDDLKCDSNLEMFLKTGGLFIPLDYDDTEMKELQERYGKAIREIMEKENG
jgi:hypothetical protein